MNENDSTATVEQLANKLLDNNPDVARYIMLCVGITEKPNVLLPGESGGEKKYGTVERSSMHCPKATTLSEICQLLAVMEVTVAQLQKNVLRDMMAQTKCSPQRAARMFLEEKEKVLAAMAEQKGGNSKSVLILPKNRLNGAH